MFLFYSIYFNFYMNNYYTFLSAFNCPLTKVPIFIEIKRKGQSADVFTIMKSLGIKWNASVWTLRSTFSIFFMSEFIMMIGCLGFLCLRFYSKGFTLDVSIPVSDWVSSPYIILRLSNSEFSIYTTILEEGHLALFCCITSFIVWQCNCSVLSNRSAASQVLTANSDLLWFTLSVCLMLGHTDFIVYLCQTSADSKYYRRFNAVTPQATNHRGSQQRNPNHHHCLYCSLQSSSVKLARYPVNRSVSFRISGHTWRYSPRFTRVEC